MVVSIYKQRTTLSDISIGDNYVTSKRSSDGIACRGGFLNSGTTITLGSTDTCDTAVLLVPSSTLASTAYL